MASAIPRYSFHFFLFCFFLSIAAATVSGDDSPGGDMTHLHFYFHELPGKGSFVVAGLNSNTTTFGDIHVSDDALTEGPDISSNVIGRAQGMSVEDSLGVPALLTATNFVFTAGEFNGSSLAMFGFSFLSPTVVSEHPVVGGSGQFRMARGYALSKILQFNATYLLLEWDFYVRLTA